TRAPCQGPITAADGLGLPEEHPGLELGRAVARGRRDDRDGGEAVVAGNAEQRLVVQELDEHRGRVREPLVAHLLAEAVRPVGEPLGPDDVALLPSRACYRTGAVAPRRCSASPVNPARITAEWPLRTTGDSSRSVQRVGVVS